ncbi:MAG: hypothetical protein C0459_08725 [Chitinophaga sp.]|nr:hypothetical protein [Chitinophaga sp.]
MPNEMAVYFIHRRKLYNMARSKHGKHRNILRLLLITIYIIPNEMADYFIHRRNYTIWLAENTENTENIQRFPCFPREITHLRMKRLSAIIAFGICC